MTVQPLASCGRSLMVLPRFDGGAGSFTPEAQEAPRETGA